MATAGVAFDLFVLQFAARIAAGGDEDNDDDLFGYDFSQGYTAWNGWRRVTAAINPVRAPLVAAAARTQATVGCVRLKWRKRRVDEVLIRVKEVGIDALSQMTGLSYTGKCQVSQSLQIVIAASTICTIGIFVSFGRQIRTSK